MKQLFIFLFVLSLGTYTLKAQVVLQDFSNLTNNATAIVYGGFGNNLTATNVAVADPMNAANTVRQYTNTAGGDAWKGIFIRPQTHYMDLTANQTVSLKVYSTTATYLRGIIQAGQSGQATIDNAANTVAHNGTGWETISFTFTGATGEWGELALRTSVDAAGNLNTTSTVTAYIDDLTAMQGSAIPAPAAGPTDSPAAPTRAAADVISIYSDAYTDIATNYNPNWGQAGSVNTTYDPGDGNNVLLYSNFNYQGTNVALTDVSTMTHLHIDIWVADATVRTIKVSPIANTGSPIEFLVTTPLTSGSWNSVDIPLTDFTGVTLGVIKELKFDGQFQTDGVTADTAVRSDVYLDNIYFWKASTASIDDLANSVSIYPNPVADFVTVEGRREIQHASIYDLTGRQVLRTTPNKAVFTLDTADLQHGLYLLTIKTDDQELTTKLVK